MVLLHVVNSFAKGVKLKLQKLKAKSAELWLKALLNAAEAPQSAKVCASRASKPNQHPARLFGVWIIDNISLSYF